MSIENDKSNYEELKILLYNFLDSCEYEFDRRYRVACSNYLIHNMIEDENTCISLLKLHEAKSQKEAIYQFSADIREILCNN